MLGRLRTLTLAGALLAAAHPAARAQVVVDASNPAIVYQVYGINGWAGQQFVPSLTNSVGAGFYLGGGTQAAGTFTVELWSDIASNPGATKLASGTTPYSFASGPQQQWVDVFWNAVGVTPGAQYFLAYTASQFGYLAVYGGPGNVYPAGSTLYQNYTGGIDTSPYVNGYPNDDLAFREYASTAAPVTSTPEPASMVLMASGLLGVAAVVRKRRQAA